MTTGRTDRGRAAMERKGTDGHSTDDDETDGQRTDDDDDATDTTGRTDVIYSSKASNTALGPILYCPRLSIHGTTFPNTYCKIPIDR